MSIDKKIDYVEQDGSLNFIKNSESVTVPKRFKARKNAPATKLAYITDAEAKMLKKMKKGTPHKGPKGIPSYDSYGSFDSDDPSVDTGMSGVATSAAEAGGGSGADARELSAERNRVRSDLGLTQLPPGVLDEDTKDYRSAFIAAGGGQRVNPRFFDSRDTVSPEELARARAYANRPGVRFAKKAFAKTRGSGGLLGLLSGGGILGNIIRGLGQRFGLGKKFNEPTYDMSESNDLGLLTDRVNPTYFNDLGNELALSTFSTPKTVAPFPSGKTPTSVNNQITPLSIFDNQVAPMGVNVDKGIVQALSTATVPEILMDFTGQIERGEPITDDEQMFVDNEIAALRGFR